MKRSAIFNFISAACLVLIIAFWFVREERHQFHDDRIDDLEVRFDNLDSKLDSITMAQSGVNFDFVSALQAITIQAELDVEAIDKYMVDRRKKNQKANEQPPMDDLPITPAEQELYEKLKRKVESNNQ